MGSARLAAAIALPLLFALVRVAIAVQSSGPPTALGANQQPYDLLPSEPPEFAQASTFVQQYSPDTQPFDPARSGNDYGQPIPGCCDVCGECSECCCEVNIRSGWTLALDASALQSQMATRDVDSWPDDFGAAGRVTLGYEWTGGFGIRAQTWGYSVSGLAEINYGVGNGFGIRNVYFNPYVDYDYWYPIALANATYSQEIELSMATTYFDFYRSITSRGSEFVIGAGPAFGHLEFCTPPYGDGSKYFGGGVTAFGQGSYAFFRRPRWGLAITGQARFSLLTGDWHIDRTWSGINGTTEHSNSMSIAELGVGPEFRRQFGRSATHYWFVRALAEYQQWRSDRMGPMGGDTLALQGAKLSFGANW